MKQEAEQQLIEYGRWLVATTCGRAAAGPPTWSGAFIHALGDTPPDPPPAALRSILSLIDIEGQSCAPAFVPPVPLALTMAEDESWSLVPRAAPAAAAGREALDLAFREAGGERETNFDRFFHLMRKFATTLPNTYGEPGVSLFEQWKMVAALVAISGATERVPAALGLVGGDIPGIQRTITTVTAKGAAKAMRGRSAFIQLLGHSLVQRLLDVLELSPANVVYDAGGNFVLLTGWQEGPDGTTALVQRVANEINRVLLAGANDFDGFHGDLAVALAATPLAAGLDALRWDLQPPDQAGDGSASRWQIAEKRLKDAVAEAKNRPFGELAGADAEGWAALFKPEPSDTDQFCSVCRRQQTKDEPDFRPLGQDAVAADLGPSLACPECRGFIALADDLGHGERRLVRSTRAPGEPAAWQRGLHEISGYWYSLERVQDAQPVTGDLILALSPDSFPGPGVDGFRWFARTTPTSEGGGIKANDELAAKSEGIKRLGVLRMDVDNLGDLIVRGLPNRTPMQTAELSQALERFFAGWLDRICSRVDKDERLLYVLFAGGDDLFVLGPWHLMPALAVAIRDDFHEYCSRHPAIHLSGGIAVVGERAPLYRAAVESHDALSDAKKLDEDEATAKDAITFLGHTVHWDEFAQVTGLKDEIVTLAEDHGLGNAVITRLLAIERRYRRDRQRGPYATKGITPRQRDAVYFGPWMWQQVYTLARLGQGRSTETGERLHHLSEQLVDGARITQLGLAARWAQWLSRKGA